MGWKSCAEKAKRRRAEFLSKQRQREPKTTTTTNTSEYNQAIKRLRK